MRYAREDFAVDVDGGAVRFFGNGQLGLNSLHVRCDDCHRQRDGEENGLSSQRSSFAKGRGSLWLRDVLEPQALDMFKHARFGGLANFEFEMTTFWIGDSAVPSKKSGRLLFWDVIWSRCRFRTTGGYSPVSPK